MILRVLAAACALACAAPAFSGGYPTGGTVRFHGSTGVDASANKPALPVVGANFGATGVYANYVLLSTLPADPNRNSWVMQTQSTTQIVLVLDDGTAAAGAQPVNATVLVYGAAGSAGGNGAGDSDPYFKGRIQMYGVAGSQAALASR